MAYITNDDVKALADIISLLNIHGGLWADSAIDDLILIQQAEFDAEVSCAYEVPLVDPIPLRVKRCIAMMVAWDMVQQVYGTQDESPDTYLHLLTDFQKVINDIVSGSYTILGATKVSGFGVPSVVNVAGNNKVFEM